MLTEIQQYLTAIRQAGRSPLTIKNYGWHLRKMAAWFRGQGIERVESVSRATLREWGAGLRNRWSPATIKQAVCAARGFFAWCTEERIIDTDPGQALKVPPVPERFQRTLTAEEVQALLDACPLSTWGTRNRALVSLMADSGLRAAEICRLRIKDLDLEVGLLQVVVKGGDEEWGFFGRATVRRLRAWLDVRSAAQGVDTLFVSLGGNTPGCPLTTDGLRSTLRRLGEQAGVDGVSPHAFRRAFACISTEAGAPSRVVQELGHWSDIRMVVRYTKALRAAKLAGQYSPIDFMESNL